MLSLSAAQIDRWADRLSGAADRAAPIEPLSDELESLGIDDAYAIAQRTVDARVGLGARIVGRKIGLTSAAVQQQLGVSEPDYGALLDSMWLPDGAVVQRPDLIAPRVELELAFHLSEDLAGPDLTADDVRRATRAVQPAIELVDSRIAGWRIRLVDTVADNASSAKFVLGGKEAPLAELDVADVAVQLERNGQLVESGSTSAVLGDPCVAVAWLGNALAHHGTGLRAGDVVLSGACTRMVSAHASDRFTGRFGELGAVGVAFG